jgi:anhydro-N-acetylmuramic acid kinase
MSEHYMGIMSGTSLDGVDVVLCRVTKSSCELLASYEHPFPKALKEDILSLIHEGGTLQKTGETDHRLGVLFSQAAEALLAREKIEASGIKAIGLHGQTLWHQPEGRSTFSMQLGDPNILTANTGIPVVADFRRKDMALGGQGAPLAPAFHEFLFREAGASVCVVNIGGMANISVLGETLIGYDTGCGNVLLDLWTEKHRGAAYDREGAWAREGEVDYPLLDLMMQDEYFALPYPKSTGREKFNEAWLEEMLSRRGGSSSPADIQRTLLELTALSISNEVLKFNPDIVMLCGGGAKNTFLVERIASLMPNIQVGSMKHADNLEAMMMAWLAYKRIHNEYIHLKEVTGAGRNAILGALYV